MRISKGSFSRACCSKGASHHHSRLAESAAGRGVGKLFSKKGGRLREFRCVLVEAVGICVWTLRVGPPVSLVRGTYLAFSDWSYVGSGCKNQVNGSC